MVPEKITNLLLVTSLTRPVVSRFLIKLKAIPLLLRLILKKTNKKLIKKSVLGWNDYSDATLECWIEVHFGGGGEGCGPDVEFKTSLLFESPLQDVSL